MPSISEWEGDMGSFFYGYVTAKRVMAQPGTSKTTEAPGMTTYIDTLSALVPAEALALYAGVVAPNTTRTASVRGKAATVISDPRLLGWSCVGLLVLSAALYVIGRYSVTRMRNGWDILRVLIPPAALAAWMLVQNPGVFDVWWRGSTLSEHLIVAAFGAVALGILAKILGYQADQAQPAAGAAGGAGPAARAQAHHGQAGQAQAGQAQVGQAQAGQAQAEPEQPGHAPVAPELAGHAPGKQGAGGPAAPGADGPGAGGAAPEEAVTGDAAANGSGANGPAANGSGANGPAANGSGTGPSADGSATGE
jgi:hypothetical protein